ncbi:MAG: type II secretion system F family protein [Candidatus Limnocylindria bacterium]
MSPLLIAILGGSAMMSIALGLWLPSAMRHRAVSRRMSSFLTTSVGGLVEDRGGRRRVRGVRRTGGRRGGPPFVAGIETLVSEAAVELTVGEVFAGMGIGLVLGLLLGLFITGSTFLAIVFSAIGAAMPVMWLKLRRRRRLGKFQSQLAESVALLASAVRAGHSLLQGLELAAKESPEPTRAIIEVVVREIGLGAPQSEALERLASMYPSEDIDLIVSAITIHQQAGGSLSKVLDLIAETIRERARIAADISALTSQQRFSAYVLSALPILVAIALFFISPDYIGVFFSSTLLKFAMGGAGFLVLVGFLVMRKMAAIDV